MRRTCLASLGVGGERKICNNNNRIAVWRRRRRTLRADGRTVGQTRTAGRRNAQGQKRTLHAQRPYRYTFNAWRTGRGGVVWRGGGETTSAWCLDWPAAHRHRPQQPRRRQVVSPCPITPARAGHFQPQHPPKTSACVSALVCACVCVNTYNCKNLSGRPFSPLARNPYATGHPSVRRAL